MVLDHPFKSNNCIMLVSVHLIVVHDAVKMLLYLLIENTREILISSFHHMVCWMRWNKKGSFKNFSIYVYTGYIMPLNEHGELTLNYQLYFKEIALFLWISNRLDITSSMGELKYFWNTNILCSRLIRILFYFS